MEFERALVPGVLLRRRQRFFADVRLDSGVEVVAHCANTGRMTSAAEPGWRVWLLPADPVALAEGRRKLAWNLELVEAQPGDVPLLVNTSRPNGVVAEAITRGQVPELGGYTSLRGEVPYGEGRRVDLMLEGEGRRCLVEVKNVTLRLDQGRAGFPDAVSERAAAHLDALGAEVARGHRAVIFYLCRSDARTVEPAAEIDPAYAQAHRRALEAGVEIMAWRCLASPAGLSLGGRVAVSG